MIFKFHFFQIIQNLEAMPSFKSFFESIRDEVNTIVSTLRGGTNNTVQAIPEAPNEVVDTTFYNM